MRRKRIKMSDPLNLFFDVQEEEEDEDLTEYLVHCYLYYKLNNPIIYDHDFDMLCKTILEKWDTLTHPNKDLVSKADLEAGTGYSIENYPKEIIEDAERRKKIFLEELKAEVEWAKKEDKKIEAFTFNNTPAETYLLCGLYRDFKYYKAREKQQIVGEELKRRWDNEIHLDTIRRYMEDHRVTPQTLNLE
jgi:hypothetical protein